MLRLTGKLSPFPPTPQGLVAMLSVRPRTMLRALHKNANYGILHFSRRCGNLKELYWIGSSLDDLKKFPQTVRQEAGYALYLAQEDGKHPDAKPLKGFGGAGTLEVRLDTKGDTYQPLAEVTVRVPGLQKCRKAVWPLLQPKDLCCRAEVVFKA